MKRRRHCSPFHIERSIASRLSLPEYPCACQRCRGGRIRRTETITKHHLKFGRDAFLRHPILANGSMLMGPVQRHGHGGDIYEGANICEDEPRYRWPRDLQVDVRRMVYEAYGRADGLEREAFEGGPPSDHVLEDLNEALFDDVSFTNLIQECTEPVYDGCSENRMQCGIVFMTLCTVFGVSDNFVSAILTYLAGTLLPRSNCLPRTSYELKAMIRKLGLEHKRTAARKGMCYMMARTMVG